MSGWGTRKKKTRFCTKGGCIIPIKIPAKAGARDDVEGASRGRTEGTYQQRRSPARDADLKRSPFPGEKL